MTRIAPRPPAVPAVPRPAPISKVWVAAVKKDYVAKLWPESYWKPEALPSVPKSKLPAAAQKEMTRYAKDYGEWAAPAAHKLTVNGKAAFAITQIVDDSSYISVFSASGKRIASGLTPGETSIVEWE